VYEHPADLPQRDLTWSYTIVERGLKALVDFWTGSV
jgi:hypothetical protein